MNTAIQCIILLACITICTSGVVRTDCQCVKTNNSVDPSRITDIKVLNPRPYCSKQEIIAILKDGRSRCLNPKAAFIQAVVKTWQMQMKKEADKINTTSPKKPC